MASSTTTSVHLHTVRKDKDTMTTATKNKFIAAAKAKWQEIGYDCLRATAADQGKNINSVLIPANEVADIVADYMYDVPGWNELSFNEHEAVLKEAFSEFKNYGT